jgi:hypothetical protein
LIRALATTGIAAGMLVSVAADAAHTATDFPAVVQSATLPTDMADWLNNGQNYSWNPANARLGKHPDRPDGVIYIFPTADLANQWWDGQNLADQPAGVPDDAVAYVHWALDNDSGEFPGIMAKTDDFDYKTNNCIMASGNTIPELTAPNNAKTCSNDQGTAKRFKLVVLKADTPIDLVFNTTTADLVYSDVNAVCNPAAVAPEVNVCDDLFRNYRYIMKWGNGTGTDTVSGPREGTRLVGFKVELGFTDLTQPATFPFTAAAVDGSDGLTYELDNFVDAVYFNKEVDGDPVEVWLPNEFATISPSMYSLVGDDRAPLGGFWDKQPAGIFPPATAQANLLDSGFTNTTANYFDVAADQGAASGVDFPDNMFGYLMYYGIFEDGDPGNISGGIYIDEDGDPATEGSIYAWWDGSSPTCCYRWGIEGSKVDGVIDADAFGLVSEEKLAEIASRPLDENNVLDPPRYEVAYTDDLGGLNSDTFIKIGPAYNTVANPTFTVRFTAHSTGPNGADLADTDPGVADGPWTLDGNPPLELADFPEAPVDPVDPVDPTPPPAADNDSGWCSYNPNGRFDPVLPGLLLAGLAYLGWKLRKKSAK